MAIVITKNDSPRKLVSLLQRLNEGLYEELGGERLKDSGAVAEKLILMVEQFQAFLAPIAEGVCGKIEESLETMMPTCHQLMRSADTLLFHLYSLQAPWALEILPRFVTAVVSFLQLAPVDYLHTCLVEMQRSFACWLEDKSHMLTTEEDSGTEKLAQAQRLGPVIIESLGKLNDIIDIDEFDCLLAAGFTPSYGRAINGMVAMWNSCYGRKSLTYGSMLRKALIELMPRLEIELPNVSHVLGELKSSDIEMPQTACGLNNSSPDESEPDEAREPTGEGSKTFQTQGPRRKHEHSGTESVRTHSSSNVEHGGSPSLTAIENGSPQRQAHVSSSVMSELPHLPTRSTEPAPDDNHAGDFQIATEDKTPKLTSRRQRYEEATQLTPTPKSKTQTLRLDEIELPSSPLSAIDNDSHEEMDGGEESSEGNKEIAGEAQLTTYSDDNDFWSASQLSHDLEKVVDSSPGSASRRKASLPASIPAKRKDSPLSERATKKRKAMAPNDDSTSSEERSPRHEQLSSPPTVQKENDQRDLSPAFDRSTVSRSASHLDLFPSKTVWARQTPPNELFEEPSSAGDPRSEFLNSIDAKPS